VRACVRACACPTSAAAHAGHRRHPGQGQSISAGHEKPRRLWLAPRDLADTRKHGSVAGILGKDDEFQQAMKSLAGSGWPGEIWLAFLRTRSVAGILGKDNQFQQVMRSLAGSGFLRGIWLELLRTPGVADVLGKDDQFQQAMKSLADSGLPRGIWLELLRTPASRRPGQGQVVSAGHEKPRRLWLSPRELAGAHAPAGRRRRPGQGRSISAGH
jgi:hypothetical protein